MSHYPEARFIKSANALSQFVPDVGAEVAVAGRSNAGKSSAINVIVNQRQFARTSKTPGRTQLVNFFELNPGVRLVDLPGYGYAKVPAAMREHWRNLLGAYFTRRASLAGLFIVMDARRPLTDFDWQMMEMAATNACRVHVLLSKCDKLGRNEARDTIRRVRAELADTATVQLFSAVSGEGLDEARRVLKSMLLGERGAAAQGEPRVPHTEQRG